MEIFQIRNSFSYERAEPLNYEMKDKDRFDPIKICQVSGASLHRKNDLKITQYYIFSGSYMLEDFCLPIQKRGKINTWKQWVKLHLFPQMAVNEAIWVTDIWSRNYFHWILECLPRILAVGSIGIKAPILLPEYIYSASYVQDSLRDFKLDVLTFNFRQAVKVSTLYLPTHDFPCAFDPKYLNSVIDGYWEIDKGKPIEGYRKIYISRSGAGKRKVKNEDALLPVLNDAGFEILQMENLSFKQQRELMRETRVLVSIHGAGLANMIFMPKGSNVVELHPAVDRYNSCFYHLATALNLNYFYSFEQGDHPNPQEANIEVDIINFKTLVKRLSGS